MWTLLRFFVRNSPFFTWLLLTILCIFLLCKREPYSSVWYNSSNAVSGFIFDISNSITGYFGLRSINEELLERMGKLEEENIRLKTALQKYTDVENLDADTSTVYSYKLAHVVSNSINHAANYITLDKGSLDGIKQDQGVADQNGVVGIVANVSDHYSLVISLLNPKLRLSASIKNRDFYGSLWWDGKSPHYALLENLPRTVKFEKGDTVVTTNYSTAFPAGVPVGTVEESFDQTENNNFLTLKVKLFTDFNRISDVFVIDNADTEERKNLMEEGVGGK